jgi:putative salt-induced outer membrane protein
MPRLRSNRHFVGFVLVCLIASTVCSRGADIVLRLKNGDLLTGSILSEADGRIRLKHAFLGEILVPVSEIAVRNVPEIAITKTAEVKTIIPKPAPVPPTAPRPKRWNFELQAGMDLGFGSTERQLYNLRGKAAHSIGRLRNSFDYMFTFGKTDGVKSADRMDASLKTDFDLRGRYFLYDLGGVGYDEVRRINLRYEVGPGVGYHIVRRDKLKVNVELGGNYQVHELSDGAQSESFFYRLAEDSFWQVTPKLAFDQRLEFFPGIADMGQYRLRFEGNMRYALRSNLYLNMTALDLYDNRPARGVVKNDLQLRSSVGLKF